MDKKSDAWGDMMRDKLRDERIVKSQENIVPDGDEWICSDGKRFYDRGDAVNHEYDILRNAA